MEEDFVKNHEEYLKRRELYKRFGYDMDKERGFIVEASKPLAGRILEVGTGKGYFALALAKQGYSFISFDVSEEEQHFAKLNLEYAGLAKQVDFRIENGEKTSFPDKSFGVILCVNVLHHLQNPHMVIDELLRILSDEGKIILADFTEEGFKVLDKIHQMEGNKHNVGKVGLSDVSECLKRKNFKIDEASTLYQKVLIAKRGNA